MKAKTAAKGMWILMALVVLSAGIFIPYRHWRQSQLDAKRQRQCTKIVEAIKDFAEREGVYPKRFSKLPREATKDLDRRQAWGLYEQERGVLFIRYVPTKKEEGIAVRLTFQPRLMIVETGVLEPGKRGKDPKWKPLSMERLSLSPRDDRVAQRTYNRMKARLNYGQFQDYQNALTYIHRKRDQKEAEQIWTYMRSRFPNSKWVKLAKAHMALSRRSNATQEEFRKLTLNRLSLYPEWFRASRLYLSPNDFYDFATIQLPVVPRQSKNECYKHVYQAAYANRNYKTAIHFCQQWDNAASFQIHAASLLATGAVTKARNVYEKYSLLETPRSFNSPLETALRRGDKDFVLPQSDTAISPFFPELNDFLIFPDI